MATASMQYVPEGYRTVTPYLAFREAPEILDFVQGVLNAELLFKTETPNGGSHAELTIGDSRLMVGGGENYKGSGFRAALHVKVEDVDEIYARALDAGATSIHAPQEFDYGERGAAVKDVAGDFWYLALPKGKTHFLAEMGTLTPYLHSRETHKLVEFLQSAFGAEEVVRFTSKHGTIEHAKIKIGNSIIEMSEAHGEYQPIATMFYMYVQNADEVYDRAIKLGAKSVHEPVDQSYGDRNGAVQDFNGNQWYIATHTKGA